jgi:hypothetical protein
MLKRIVRALLITVASTVVFALLFLVSRRAGSGIARDSCRLVLAAILVVVAVFLPQRGARWQRALFLGSAGALLIVHAFDLFVSISMSEQLASERLQSFLFHSCLMNPWLWEPRCALELFGWCFPFFLFLWALSRTPTSNPVSQQTAGNLGS